MMSSGKTSTWDFFLLGVLFSIELWSSPHLKTQVIKKEHIILFVIFDQKIHQCLLLINPSICTFFLFLSSTSGFFFPQIHSHEIDNPSLSHSPQAKRPFREREPNSIWILKRSVLKHNNKGNYQSKLENTLQRLIQMLLIPITVSYHIAPDLTERKSYY